MFYAVIYVLIVNGTNYLMVEPMPSIEACRAFAAIIRNIDDEKIGDARCTMIIPDKD